MADDVAALGISVDSSGVVAATQDLRNYEDIARRTGETVQQVQARFAALATARQQQNQQTQAGTQATTQNAAATQRAATALAAHTAATTNTANAAKHAADEAADLARVFSILVQQFTHNSESLGRVGQALHALGPVGIAVGAVFGTLAIGFELLSSAAENFAKRATDLQNFVTISGLTIEQAQGLKAAAEELGVGAATAQTFVDRLTFSLAQARVGQGELYTTLVKINPQFAQQLALTRTTAQAINVLAQAYQQAGSLQSKLLQSAGGRGGLVAAPLIASIGEAGGIEGIVSHLHDAIQLTAEEAKQLQQLNGRLEELKNQNANTFDALFSTFVLQRLIDFQTNIKTLLSIMSSGVTAVRNFGSTLVNSIPAPVLEGLKAIGSYFNKNTPAPTLHDTGTGGGHEQNIPSNLTKQDIAQRAQLYANQLKDINTALGAGATESDKLNAKLAELDAQFKNGAFSIMGAEKAQELYNRAVRQTNADEANRLLQASTAALGNAATVTEQYTAKERALDNQVEHGTITREAYNRAVAQLPIDKANQLLQSNVSALGDAATAQEKYNAQVSDLKIKRDQGAVSEENFQRALTNLNPTIKELRESFTQLAQGIVSGLLNGKSAADSLRDSLKSVTQTAANSAIENLIKGDFAKAGTSALIAGGSFLASKLVGGATAEEKAADQKKQEDQLNALHDAGLRAEGAFSRLQVALLDTSTRAGAVAAQEEQFRVERANEIRSGGQELNALIAAQGAERIALQRKFDAEDLARLNENLARQKTFQDRLFAATNDSSTLEGQLAAFDRQAQQQREDEVKAGGAALADLEAALGAERVKITADYNKQIVAAEKAAFKEILDYVESLKTSALSTLAPEQQLMAAQANFTAQLTRAQAGDKDALSNITKAAQTLLEQARSFYGPSVAFGSVYNATTSSLTALAGGALGGLVGRYAYGGLVGNGTYGRDSVLASYAGGGGIALAGGEFVTRSGSVNSGTLPMLDQINRTGRSGNDNSSVVAAISNLTREVAMLRSQNIQQSRLLADGNERTSDVGRKLDGLRVDTRQAAGTAQLRIAAKAG